LEIIVSVHTYNTYGGHGTLTLVGKYLELEVPDFGSAINELDIHVYFSGGQISQHLKSLSEQYHEFLSSLPSTKFYRKKAKFELNFVSELGNAELVSGYKPPNLELFINSTNEVVSLIEMLKSKIKKSDNFDFQEFNSFLQSKLDNLPKDKAQFDELQSHIENENMSKQAAMSDWDKLGIDWEDYHPVSRKILDSPFFWSCIDDFSPNGNDTGADVLELYRDWKQQNPKGKGANFLGHLLDDWGVEWPSNKDDEYSRTTYEEMILGLSFAQIKLDGECETAITEESLKVIGKIRQRIIDKHRDWEHFEERLRTLDELESKLIMF
jgi:uncharacterized protein YfeS